MERPADPIDPRVAPNALGSPRTGGDVPPLPPRPCRITFHGFAPSEPPQVEVRAWLKRLGALTAPMIGGQVTIEALDRGRKERHYRVHLELVMPAGPVFVGVDHPTNFPHEDVYVAIRNAFRAARRALEMQRDEVTVVPEVTQ